jgi:hypothetical protein
MSEHVSERHHSGLTVDSVRDALLAALDVWEQAGCDCCSPTPLDDALDGLGDHGDRLRRFGLELAMSGQWMLDEDADEGPR